jgi:hypothetical protein
VAAVIGIFAFRGALADHSDHPVAAVLAKVGDAGGAGLVDAQGIVQQQPHHGRGAQRLGAGGGGDPGAGLVPVQADRVPPQVAQNSNPRSAWRSGR